MNEGKATIRFTEPPHDLCISKVTKPNSVGAGLPDTFMLCIHYTVYVMIHLCYSPPISNLIN